MTTLRLKVGGWRVYLVLGWCNILAYHRSRGNWQLWTPLARVFVYSPSRLRGSQREG